MCLFLTFVLTVVMKLNGVYFRDPVKRWVILVMLVICVWLSCWFNNTRHSFAVGFSLFFIGCRYIWVFLVKYRHELLMFSWPDKPDHVYKLGLAANVRAWSLFRHTLQMLRTVVDVLHVTSWRPCWWTGTIRLFSSGSSFLCKLCEQIFFCFVHQNGGNAWMQTIYI